MDSERPRMSLPSCCYDLLDIVGRTLTMLASKLSITQTGEVTSYHRDPHARREHHEESDTNASLPLTPVVLAYPFALMIKA